MVKKSGFSLLEIIITLVIIAVLIAISVPSYQYFFIKAHRADGQVALLKLSGVLENYYLSEHTYNGATLSALGQTDTSAKGYYRLAIILQNDGQSYQVQAIPLGSLAKLDAGCGTLQLSTDGRRSFLGTDPTGECW